MTITKSRIGEQATRSHEVVRNLYGFTKNLTRDRPGVAGGAENKVRFADVCNADGFQAKCNTAGKYINHAYERTREPQGDMPLVTKQHRQRGMVNGLRGSALFMRSVPDQILKYTIGRGCKKIDLGHKRTQPDYDKVLGGHKGEVLRRHGVVGLALRGVGDGVGWCCGKATGASDTHESRMKGREVVDIGMNYAVRAPVAALESGLVVLSGAAGAAVGPLFAQAKADPRPGMAQ